MQNLLVLVLLLIAALIGLYGLWRSGAAKNAAGDVPVWLWRSFIGLALAMDIVAAVVYARNGAEAELAAAISGMFVASTVGGLMGFLFGIPRVLQSTAMTTGDASESGSYVSNTNLERISDWLTTIIIGLSLVEFKDIMEYFDRAARMFASEIGGNTPFMPGAILLSFAVCGFLGSYLWTRIRLVRDFTDADAAAKRGPEYFEGLMYAYLFNDPPDGYQRAIELGRQYLTRFRQASPRVWLYFACAYGQQHGYLTDQKKRGADVTDSALCDAADLTLSNSEKAILGDPTVCALLRSLRKPASRAPFVDDDLVSLAGDDRFDRLFDDHCPVTNNT